MKSTILTRIAGLYEEQRQLHERAGRGEWLNASERGRLIEIDVELEKLWNKRRAEKAGVDPDSMPHVVVLERESRHGPRFEQRSVRVPLRQEAV